MSSSGGSGKMWATLSQVHMCGMREWANNDIKKVSDKSGERRPLASHARAPLSASSVPKSACDFQGRVVGREVVFFKFKNL